MNMLLIDGYYYYKDDNFSLLCPRRFSYTLKELKVVEWGRGRILPSTRDKERWIWEERNALNKEII